jgi:hypothetical protein
VRVFRPAGWVAAEIRRAPGGQSRGQDPVVQHQPLDAADNAEPAEIADREALERQPVVPGRDLFQHLLRERVVVGQRREPDRRRPRAVRSGPGVDVQPHARNERRTVHPVDVRVVALGPPGRGPSGEMAGCGWAVVPPVHAARHRDVDDRAAA